MNWQSIEIQLKKVTHLPSWGRKQNDEWDKRSSYIYSTNSFDKLLEIIVKENQEFKNYVINRWFNFWSAKGVEMLFSEHKEIIANEDKYNKIVDFTLNGISFDHKSTVFPKQFPNSVDYALLHKKELLKWLYINQSKQGRFHIGNRLFVVLFAKDGQHWQLKKELTMLKPIIDNYITTFKPENLTILKSKSATIVTDIIWFIY